MIPPRLAVVGHVEHITLGRVEALPTVGEIVHVDAVQVFAGGGGGLALLQMLRGAEEVHAFTALGNDEAARAVRSQLEGSGARLHAARRETPQTRDVVLLTPDGERTILVLGAPLHPLAIDPLPWELLAKCHGVYFTAEDPDALLLARRARQLVVTARRKHVLDASGVVADVVVGSESDARERSRRRDYRNPPVALVMTEGARGGFIETAAGIRRFAAPVLPGSVRGSYGAGDSFAGALTAYLAAGFGVEEACARAALHGAAVLGAVAPVGAQRRLDFSPAPAPSGA
jgi:ribokinase